MQSLQMTNDKGAEYLVDGVNVFFFDWDKRRISGWSFDVKEGDIIKSKMESGKVGLFKVTRINRMGNPRDQYFGDVEDIGYE